MIKKTFFKKIINGFTLIELIVVISIVSVISVLTLFNSSGLNSSVLLSNTAYEVGLIIRDAQTSGLGSKISSLDNEGVATTSNQGVYFDKYSSDKVIFFADINSNNSYNIGDQLQTYQIENKKAGKILKICKILNDNSCSEVLDLNIIFKRPNPEAYFYTSVDGFSGLGYQGSFAINLGFDNGECRSIIIYKTGAIQIDKTFCN